MPECHDYRNGYFEYLSKQLDNISGLSEIGLIVYHLDTKTFFVSKSAGIICGLHEGDDIYQTIFQEVIHPEDREILNQIYHDFFFQKGKLENYAQLIRIRNMQDEYDWYMIRAVYMYSELNEPLSISFSFFNATFHTVSQELFDKVAFYDELTGFPNKRKFVMDCKNNDLLTGLHVFCVLSISDIHSLDNLTIRYKKDFNIKKFASIMQKYLPEESIYAYLDNSIFVITLPVTNNYREEVKKFFQSIQREVTELNNIEQEEFQLFLRGGYCLFGEKNKDQLVCMENAMIALKMNSLENNLLTDTHCLTEYKEAFKNDLLKKEQLITDLQNAIEKKEFIAYYQPKINPHTVELEGMEALIRWNHPQNGILPPSAFIPIAEETGLILEISQNFMQLVCSQNKQWQEKGLKPQVVSVNISPMEFYKTDIIDTVNCVLSKTGLDARWLDLEITEGIALTDVNLATKKINELKALGVSISIDDFGSGYSSLSYLKNLPAQTVKVDRALIEDIVTNDATCHVAEAVVNLLKKLNKKAICEGVETESQVSIIKQLGYDCIQGYYYSKPLPSNEFETKYLNQ